MENNKDAFGQEILARYRGERSYEIVEREDGYFDLSDGAKSYFAEYPDWRNYEKRALKYVRGRVLDVGCGAGRHALYLQRKKFDITGIDASPLAVKVCKLRGLKKAKLIPIEKIDQFKKNSFDTIIMMGNNFGLFGDFKKAKLLLKKMHKITSSDALIVAESLDIYKTAVPEHRQYHQLNKKRGRLPGQLKMRIRFKKYVSDWFDYLMASPLEMKKIVANTGWRINKFIKSDGANYIALIEKINR